MKAKVVYCYDNKNLPKPNIPVLTYFRVRKLGALTVVEKVAVLAEDLFSDGKYSWYLLDGDGKKVQPFAWLDTDTSDVGEQWIHNLAKLGELPL